MGTKWTILVAMVAVGVGCAPSSEAPSESAPEAALPSSPPPGADYDEPAFVFNEIREGIYHATGTGNLSIGGNSAVIINEDHVMLVDSHISPASAWALLEQLREITDKPVRYVVNTHFHFDHTHGNQIYPEGVQIIGHEFTRQKLLSGGTTSGRGYEAFVVAGIPNRIANLEQRLAQATEEEKAEIEQSLRVQRNYRLATDAVEPTPPNVTLSRHMTIVSGEREMHLYYFGRGHTGGDLVVHLPAERVLIAGDLIVETLPYMGDAYLAEWADTLEELKKLDFDVVLGEHGQAVHDLA